jgi:hypothetical protein
MKCHSLKPESTSPQHWVASPGMLQKLSAHQHTWHCCYHGDSSPFAFLNLGVEAGAGHS